MSFLFGKKQKQTVTAMAEVMENGASKVKEWLTNNMDKIGKVEMPMFKILVHVTPEGGSPFDAQMETGRPAIDLMRPGVHVWVNYDPNQKEQVSLVDDVNDILTRNPQLKGPAFQVQNPQLKELINQAQKPVTPCPACGKNYEGTPKFCPNCGHPISS